MTVISDDVALLAIMVREALVRLGPANGIEAGNLAHADLTRALREVLEESGSEVHLTKAPVARSRADSQPHPPTVGGVRPEISRPDEGLSS